MTALKLVLDRRAIDKLYRQAVAARAHALEAQAEAELAVAAWYAALGAREAAGDATDRAAQLRRDALLQARMPDDGDDAA